MNKEIIRMIHTILQDNGVGNFIYKDTTLSYQDYMTARDYIDRKLEEEWLLEKLHDIRVQNKQYEKEDK